MYNLTDKHRRIIRFVLAGGVAACINFSAFYILVRILSLQYILSSMAAFGVAALASFVMQKLWTFQDASTHRVHIQLSLFLAMSIFNVGLNALFVYAFVTYGHIGYLPSQVLAGCLVAVETFFLLRDGVFKRSLI